MYSLVSCIELPLYPDWWSSK